VRLVSSGEHELVYQQIEASTEVVDDIANDCPPHWRDFLRDFDPKHALAGLRIFVGDNAIGLARNSRADKSGRQRIRS
jgi:hypothetical protein